MTSGVFTLPLFGIDTSSGHDGGRVDEGCWGFITGPENALLRVLITAAASHPPQYNPITLCGPTGVGKTHLLLGVMNQVRAQQIGTEQIGTQQIGTEAPERKCWHLSGADFARQYARSVELDTLPELREKLAATTFLFVDGLDELSLKPGALHELLRIVDRSIERQTHLFFSCQSAQAQWSWMPSGLRSRLEGGLIIPVAIPGEATRREILRQLSAELGVQSRDESVAACRQTASRQTFRELKHELLQLTATERVVEQTKGVSGRPESTHQLVHSVAIRRISKTVARSFEIKFSELIGPSRRKTTAQARGVAVYLARSCLGVSFEQLGKNFGNRDHTTILHAYRKIAASLERDLVLKQMIERLREEVDQ